MLPPDVVLELPATIVDEPPVIPAPADKTIPDSGLSVFNTTSPAFCVLDPIATRLLEDASLPMTLPEEKEIEPLDFPGVEALVNVTAPLDSADAPTLAVDIPIDPPCPEF